MYILQSFNVYHFLHENIYALLIRSIVIIKLGWLMSNVYWVWWHTTQHKNVIFFSRASRIEGTGDNALLSFFHCNSVKAIFVLWMKDPDQSFWGKVSLMENLNMRRKLHSAHVGHSSGCIAVVWGQIICTFSFLLYVNKLYSCLKLMYRPPSI